MEEILYLLFRNKFGKMLKRTIEGLFRVLGEKATGQLSLLQMVGNTVTADAFAAARIV